MTLYDVTDWSRRDSVVVAVRLVSFVVLHVYKDALEVPKTPS